jgi:hypothetical protein
MDSHSNANIKWNLLKKFLFRFLFIYFLFYCFPFPLDGFDILAPVARPYYDLIDWMIPIAGDKLFHLHAHVSFPTFDKVDDSFYGLVFIYLNLIVSFLGALSWGFFDRNGMINERLNEWLKLYLRFFLAAYLFGYGFVKVFPSQFEAITASRLAMPVGDQSPMLLAWNFMGYSTTMMKVNGWAEAIAGLLLLFRRTSTLGAILSIAVFSFIVMMDFSFNVFVRLLSSHLLVISTYLVLCDRRRLLNVFVLNKPTNAVLYIPLINNTLRRKIFEALLSVLAICLVYSSFTKGLDAYRSFGQTVPHVPLYGIYKTDYFVRNKDTIPASAVDSLRWEQLVMDGGSWNQSCSIAFSNDKRSYYDVEADTIKRTLNVRSKKDTTKKYMFNYFLPDTIHIFFRGRWSDDSIRVLMSKYDLNNYLLHRERFKWITN